jgi:hypothetical protein
MTLQLVRGDTDSHLWAENYDGDTNNVAALPDVAARAIAARLNGSTPPHASGHYLGEQSALRQVGFAGTARTLFAV